MATPSIIDAGDRARNTAAVTAQLMCDIALQLRRPTGHAVNPVPLTEAERIPSAAEIVEVHLLAREIERRSASRPTSSTGRASSDSDR